ncbi:MAG: DEAD/DEAH box helicase [Bacilli bacterium]
MKEQFQAGYILEGTKNDLTKFPKDKVDGLLKSLSAFDIETNLSFQHKDSILNPYFSVLNNIFTRGIPTKPSTFIEDFFTEKYNTQSFDQSLLSKQLGNIKYKSDLSKKERNTLFEALHLIDPRISFNPNNYNTEILDSSFEKDFLFKYIDQEKMGFLSHLLLPQRSMDSIVPEHLASKFPKQQVDFSIEVPYLNSFKYSKYGNEKKGFRKNIGSVIEIDGHKYHSSISQKLLDDSRDESVNLSNWETLRIKTLEEKQIINWFTKDNSELSDYIQTIGNNYKKSLHDKVWLQFLEVSLAPFAIARLQKVLIELLLSGNLDLEKEEWNITVLERDIPCANLAFKDFQNWLSKLFSLSSNKNIRNLKLPKLNLAVISTVEFKNSKLHQQHENVYFEDSSVMSNSDLIIDISILTRSVIEKSKDYSRDFIRIRSSHYIDSQRYIYTSDSIKYIHATVRGENEEYIPVKDVQEKLTFFLQNIFRKQSFREGQLPILNRAIQGKSVIGLLPTGGGKSLTYQLASMLQPGVTMVIDPIKSLMQDQFDSLVKVGIDCCNFINSKLDKFEREIAIDKLTKSNILFTFISPERLQIDSFRATLQAMHDNSVYFSYCVIDEVHCVSEWGHDFRTSYLSLGRNALEHCKTKNYPNELIPLFGLTATASFDVLSDVERELSGDGQAELDAEAIVRFENTNRNELQYQVIEVKSDFDKKESFTKKLPDGNEFAFSVSPIEGAIKNKIAEDKQDRIVKLLPEIPNQIKFYNNQSDELISLAQKRVFDNSQLSVADISISDFDVKSFYKPRKVDEISIFDNGGIVFTPHRTWYQGVTDQFKFDRYDQDVYDDEGNIIHRFGEFILDENGNKVRLPLSKRKGIADSIKKSDSKYQVGIFMGSSNEDDKTGKEIEATSFANQSKFINSEQNIMVATKAFGMGIDKPNVRFTIHFNFPSSIESFVQEAGRAGRDRKIALSTIIFNQQIVYYFNSDFYKAIKNYITEDDLKKLSLFKDTRFLEDDLRTVLNEIGLNNLFDDEVFQENIGKINVDRDNLKYFHDNSFKGEEKEKVIIFELLNRISFPNSKQIRSLSEQLEEITGLEEVYLSLNGNWLNVNAGYQQKVGGINLDNFHYSFHFSVFKRNVAEQILNSLTDIIKASFASFDDTTLLINWLNQAIAMEFEDGIEKKLEKIEIGEEISPKIEIHFNNKYADKTIYIRELTAKLQSTISQKISQQNVEDCLCANYMDFIDNLADKRPDLQINELDEDVIKKCLVLFYSPRTKADTDKALFRLLSIGVIDDYTVDYNKKTYTLKVVKKKEGGYEERLFNYIKRYYSEIRANQEIEKVSEYKGNSEIQKCLGFLTDFIYREIERKRLRAIDDMIFACRIGLQKDGNEELKDFIFMYFNSKYAKKDYTIKDKGYSLTVDTNDAKDFSFDNVWKYIEAIKIDDGSEKDNVKHLRGACLRLLRTNPENGALLVLKSFTLFVLGFGDNEVLLNETKDGLIEGFKAFKRHFPEMQFKELMSNILLFKERTLQFANNKNEVLLVMDEFINLLYVDFHKEWLTNFNDRYLKGYDR